MNRYVNVDEDTYINSRLFPMGVGRNNRTSPATILFIQLVNLIYILLNRKFKIFLLVKESKLDIKLAVTMLLNI